MRQFCFYIILFFSTLAVYSKTKTISNGSINLNYDAADTVFTIDKRKITIKLISPLKYKSIEVKINNTLLTPIKATGLYEFETLGFNLSNFVIKNTNTLNIVLIDAKGNESILNYIDTFYVKNYVFEYKSYEVLNESSGIGLITKETNTFGVKSNSKNKIFYLLIENENQKKLYKPEIKSDNSDEFVYFKLSDLKQGKGFIQVVDKDTNRLGKPISMAVIDNTLPKIFLKYKNKSIKGDTTLKKDDIISLKLDYEFNNGDKNNVQVYFELLRNKSVFLNTKERMITMTKELEILKKNKNNLISNDIITIWGDYLQFVLPKNEENDEEFKNETYYSIFIPFKYKINIK
ncbi:MAG: hypothetical protein U0V72_04510 [Cytophagales bacterium]